MRFAVAVLPRLLIFSQTLLFCGVTGVTRVTALFHAGLRRDTPRVTGVTRVTLLAFWVGLHRFEALAPPCKPLQRV